MHRIAYILFTIFLLRIGCVPSGLKIESGRDAKDDEFPFIVSLESRIILTFGNKMNAVNNVHLCTCVALSPTWTLTAGHCVDSVGPTKDLSDSLRIQTVIRYGSINSSTVEVIASVLHPSFHDPQLKLHNDIGLLRTEIIRLKKFAVLSTVDINTLGGHDVTLVGHTNANGSLRIGGTDILDKTTPPQLLKLFIVRFDNKNESTLPIKCVVMHCQASSSLCDGDSGGPMLHSTGVIGINTLSLENIRLCSAVNKNGLVRMDFITPTSPHLKWINENIRRDAEVL
ncbi:hypothetical protein PYW08_000094 [Mythimna loreyi]|uniref:Uncharacterized protein n=1 Tax=Mythimna loreyi TaxID=667449 RepID=A0ACC2RAX5_9NEOP|nr:hypothetical protein PYW08_000094 [Mythimna loreyi]